IPTYPGWFDNQESESIIRFLLKGEMQFPSKEARVVKWQTRTLEVRMGKPVRVRVPPRAPFFKSKATNPFWVCGFCVYIGKKGYTQPVGWVHHPVKYSVYFTFSLRAKASGLSL